MTILTRHGARHQENRTGWTMARRHLPTALRPTAVSRDRADPRPGRSAGRSEWSGRDGRRADAAPLAHRRSIFLPRRQPLSVPATLCCGAVPAGASDRITAGVPICRGLAAPRESRQAEPTRHVGDARGSAGCGKSAAEASGLSIARDCVPAGLLRRPGGGRPRAGGTFKLSDPRGDGISGAIAVMSVL